MRRWLVLLASICTLGAARASETISLPAESFKRHFLTIPGKLASILHKRNLAGGTCCEAGWFEYDFAVAETGWYELYARGGGADIEYLVDADAQGEAAPGYRFWFREPGRADPTKVGNVWLIRGAHRIRLQHFFWTGFPALSGLEFRRSKGNLGDSLSVVPPDDAHLYRRGSCPSLEILYGGALAGHPFAIVETDPAASGNSRRYAVTLAETDDLARLTFALPCERAGEFRLHFDDGDASLKRPGLKEFRYEVFDPAGGPGRGGGGPGRQALAFDCVKRVPDYAQGDSRIVPRSFGAYRESGANGWHRRSDASPAPSGEPDWFAYRLDGLVPGNEYRIEVDVPDDAYRSFAMALRESIPGAYPVAIGVDSGGEYRIGGGEETASMIVWPRAAGPRLVFMPVHDGDRAACLRVRVFEAAGAPGERNAAGGATPRRDFASWYEEAENFAALFGVPGQSERDLGLAAERWAATAARLGATMLMPSAVVYGAAMYPSKFHRTFSVPDKDVLRRIFVTAERHGLKVVPELHPRADELGFAANDGHTVPANALISANGGNTFFLDASGRRNLPPYYNALDPGNQEWYVGMIGELADRYRDSPAFAGIALRRMNWQDPALNNVVSLDWGYDDETVARFKRDTGSDVPLGRPGDPGRFAQRHAWLSGPGRSVWVSWRCARIAELVTRIRDRVRRARPDLKLYIDVFAPLSRRLAPSFSRTSGPSLGDQMRESGVDPELLGRIEGVELINATGGHGRPLLDGIFEGWRDMLLDPDAMAALRAPGQGGQFLSSTFYVEANEALVAPERLGFPSSTRRTWMSAVFDPAGRNALERYALALAETDAVLLGDGGNGYLFGSPALREFLADYVQLPPVAFASRNDASDPVAVRTLADKESFMFYAVNREPYPITVEILLNRAGAVTRPATGKVFDARDRILRLELQAYELFTGRAEPGTAIERIATAVPLRETQAVARQAAWLAGLERGQGQRDNQPLRLEPRERRLVSDALARVRGALANGHIWRARTILQHSSLLNVYRRVGCFPPALFDDLPGTPACTP